MSVKIKAKRKIQMQSLADRVTALLPKWKKGFDVFRLPDLKLGKWIQTHIVTVNDIYLDDESGFGDFGQYVDIAQAQYDFREIMRKDLPDCDVNIEWQCGEAEIVTKKYNKASKEWREKNNKVESEP